MTFPRSPKLPKGALIAIDPSNNIIISSVGFQYNPETISRNLEPEVMSKEEGEKLETRRFTDAPSETIDFDVEIDATDQLENSDATAIEFGIYPQLFALETLIYPKSKEIIDKMNSRKNGKVEVISVQAPMTLLVWGRKRVIPVRLTNFDITEEAYDAKLNPIRATVSLSLEVLTYQDLPWNKTGSKLFLAYHKVKEQIARQGNINNPAKIISVTI